MSEWCSELDEDVLACLKGGPKSAADLGRRVGVSEAGLASVLLMLAAEGKIRISRVQLADTAERRA